LNRDLLFLASALLTWGIGEGMFFSFQPLYLQELGADPQKIGVILGGVGLTMMLVHLPSGFLSDRIGRRPLLYASWLIGCLATLIMALASSLPVFVLGSILYGFTAFVIAPLNSYISAARGNWSVGRLFTLISATFSLGYVLGPLIGGWIGETFGMKQTFIWAALIFVVSTLLIFFIRAQPIENQIQQTSIQAMQRVLSPPFIRYLSIVFFVVLAIYLPQPLSQNFLQNEKSLDLIQIGRLLAVTSIGGVLLNLSLGQLNARTGFVLAQVCMFVFAFFIWQGQSLPWFVLAYFLLGSYRTARSLAAAQSRSLVDSSQMGLAFGWVETAAASAVTLAPPLAGLLYTTKPSLVYPVSMVAIAAALIITLLFSPAHNPEANL
jgi:MFS family permease